ncbi:MAG: GNAT family N-acetyltransferase [Clostridiales bacterium]|nr:GNAT family N-acetyltransferase [Clostridiales bacterium]
MNEQKTTGEGEPVEFVELETKEDIITAGLLARKVAPSVLTGPALDAYLDGIEQKIRQNMENDTEYYIMYQQGPVGFAALVNSGDCLTLAEVGILSSHRGKGLLKRFLAFAVETYDPPLVKIESFGQSLPALAALGYTKNGNHYEKKFYDAKNLHQSF